jgi:iron(III) transport system ATP-binding protein
LRCAFAAPVEAGARVVMAARPEDFALTDQRPEGDLNVLTGKIAHRVFLGELIDYIVDHGSGEIRVRARPDLDLAVGRAVHVAIAPRKCIGFRR